MRERYRQDGKVKTRTFANITHLGPARIEAIRGALSGSDSAAGLPLPEAFRIDRPITPGLVFAASGAKFRHAIEASLPAMAELVCTEDALPGGTMFSDLTRTSAGRTLEDAHATVTAETTVKFLFASGSTGMQRAVINTQRMWCSNHWRSRRAVWWNAPE